MRKHRGFSGKALLIVLLIFLLSGLLIGGAALSLGLLPFRMHMHASDGNTDAEMHRENVVTVGHWGFPGRFLGLTPFLFCLGPIFHLGALVLIVGLCARLLHHRRWHACHPEHGSCDKHEHPPFGPHGHWHHHHCWRSDEAQHADETEPASQETQEFKVE